MAQPMFQTPEKRTTAQNARSTSPFVKYNNKCVCEICNCNTHKCPTEHPPQKKIVPLSHQDYKYPSNFEKASPFRPQRDYTPTRADPNHFKTSNQLNFQPNYYQGSPPQERVKKGGAHQTSNELYPKIPGIYETEYRQGVAKEKDYNFYHPSRPKEKYQKPLPFDGKSTYRENFHSINPLDYNTPIKTKDNLMTDTKAPFNATSNYKQEFVPYPLEKGKDYYNRNKESHIVRPEQVSKPISNYQNAYSPYKPEYYIKPGCPMKFLPPPPRYLSPGKSHIHYNDEINNWD